MNNRIIVSLLILLSMSTNVFALGSGALSNETGINAKVTGHGYAVAGAVDDASAVFYNPASMVNVKGAQLMYGASVLDINTEHASTTGQKDKTADNLPVTPYFYFTYSKVDSPWAFGVGVNSPFGLISEWKDNSSFKYYATESKLMMYQITPAVAYQVSGEFSVAGGVNFFNVFDTELNQKVFNLDSGLIPGSPTGDGDSKLTGDGTGLGYNLSAHWKPSDIHSFGLTYRSQVNVPVEGDVHLSNLQDGTAFGFNGASLASTYDSGATTEFKFPQSVLLGYGYRPNEKWTIYTDYEWVNWNVVENLDFNYSNDNTNLTHRVARNWKNSNNFGAGAEYSATEHVDLRFGALVYERVIPEGTYEATVPESGRYALTLGSGYHAGGFAIDFSYSAIFLNDKTINNGAGSTVASMDGKYETMINTIALGVSHKFGG